MIFFLLAQCVFGVTWIHWDDDLSVLNCQHFNPLVQVDIAHLYLNETCLCEESWLYEDLTSECDGPVDGCATACNGGGFCKVANRGCLEHVQLASDVIACDDTTPVAGTSMCDSLYCGCTEHTDCDGATFCANTCIEGECGSSTDGVCQPCTVCESDVEFASDCQTHCEPYVDHEVVETDMFETVKNDMSEHDKQLREDCFLACLGDPLCGQGDDLYIFVNTAHDWCAYGRECANFWGDSEMPPIVNQFDESAEFEVTEIEQWRVLTDAGDSRQYECSASSDCDGLPGDFVNCCQSGYDIVPVCSRKESVHCENEQCAGKEKWCGTLKGNLKCIPEEAKCPENLQSWSPILMALLIVVIALVRIIKSYREELHPDMIESTGSVFASFDRRPFMEDAIVYPEHTPAWKFNYDAQQMFFIFANVWSSSLADAIPMAINIALIAGMISWYRVYARTEDSGDAWDEDKLMSQLAGFAEITDTMKTYVSLLLVFILVNRLNWFFSVLGFMYRTQGCIHSLGLILGPVIKTEEVAFDAYRYLNLIHFYLHQTTTIHLRQLVDEKNLEECGLITEEERILLENSWDKRKLVLKWMSKIITEYQEMDNVNSEEGLARTFMELRENCQLTLRCIGQTIPYSVMQLSIMLTYFWLILLPCSMYHSLTKDVEHNVFNWYPMIGTGLVALFFGGILNTIISLAVPTGDDLDDVNPEALLFQTDKTLALYLAWRNDHAPTSPDFQKLKKSQKLQNSYPVSANVGDGPEVQLSSMNNAGKERVVDVMEMTKRDEMEMTKRDPAEVDAAQSSSI